MSSNHPLKQLAFVINNEINCGTDIAELIVSFHIDFKQLKSDLANAMKDRIDRKLEYKKIYYQEEINKLCILDYEITSIIHEKPYKIIFTSFLHYSEKNLCIQTFVSFDNSNLLLQNKIENSKYTRKSWNRFKKEDFDRLCEWIK